ncbi:hypothetical protein GE061_018174 [Apolygus lucorum]|uniref:Uncharacterized protein n=1 Tax=Apolygus lucorum TaxID=248454 RepID=A0A8S9XF87_APOLU|nr:hypothetical protein GE061_018174 [Apolygus lucorum]
MPGRRAKSRAIGPWVDLHDLPPPPRQKKKRSRNRKRFHPSFRVFLALGLMPSKARQLDPQGLRYVPYHPHHHPPYHSPCHLITPHSYHLITT